MFDFWIMGVISNICREKFISRSNPQMLNGAMTISDWYKSYLCRAFLMYGMKCMNINIQWHKQKPIGNDASNP